MQPPPKATLVGIATAGQAVGFSVTLFLLLSGQALGYSVTLFLLVSFSPSFLLYLVTDLASSAPKTTEMVFCRAGAPCQEIPPPPGVDVVPLHFRAHSDTFCKRFSHTITLQALITS